MRPVKFIPRERVQDLHQAFPTAHFYDTSTHAPLAHDFDYVKNFSLLSPFIPYGNIPIPGRAGEVSDSVEGVWQGLKVMKGRIDESYFRGKGRQRPGRVEGHLLGNRTVGYTEARNRIFIPSYAHMLALCKEPQNLLAVVYERALRDEGQYFFDVDHNPDIHDHSSPLAHSSVLVQIVNMVLRSPSDDRKRRDASHI